MLPRDQLYWEDPRPLLWMMTPTTTPTVVGDIEDTTEGSVDPICLVQFSGGNCWTFRHGNTYERVILHVTSQAAHGRDNNPCIFLYI